MRAKELICEEKRLEVGFPFKLSSGYITSEYCEIVINDKEGLEVAISLSTAGEYLQSKLWSESNIRLCRIDWGSHLAAMNKLQGLMRLWLSKSFTNFAGISHRLH